MGQGEASAHHADLMPMRAKESRRSHRRCARVSANPMKSCGAKPTPIYYRKPTVGQNGLALDLCCAQSMAGHCPARGCLGSDAELGICACGYLGRVRSWKLAGCTPCHRTELISGP